MKKIFKAILMAVTASILIIGVSKVSYAKAITETDFLKASGTSLRNESGKGNRILLRGINVGGWFVQELWMCPTKETKTVKDQKTIESTLLARFGKEKAGELLDTYYDNFWTEKDFDNCQAMGMNCLRLPIWHYNIIDQNGEIREDILKRIDWFIEEAGKRGIYVIIDMHGAPGSQNDKDHSGDISSNMAFWKGPDAMYNQKLYIQIWKIIAERYQGNPTVAGYDLLNEPYCATGEYTDSSVWDLYDRAYKAIRAIDKDHVIIMEGTWEPYNLPNPTKYGWVNVMYEYHCYNYDSQQNAEDQLKTVQRKINAIKMMDYDVPSYIGETSFFSNTESWKKCLSELNNNDISWTLWTYKVTGSGNNSWGIYNMPIESADLQKDSFEDIKIKWQACNTENAVENKDIKPIVESFISYSPNQIKIGGATVSGVTGQIYTGRAIKPSFTVRLNGTVLVREKDYTVRYSNNIQCGTATAVVTGAGKYDGIIVVYFKIVPSRVEIVNKKTVSQNKSITITWKKNLNADGYYIYKYERGKYKRIAKLKSFYTSYKMKKLKAGKIYKFKIVPYKIIDKRVCEGESNTVTVATKAKATKLKVKKSKKKIQFSWKKIKNVSGYEILRSRKKSGKYTRVKRVSAKTKSVFYKTKKGTKYYKIRAYIKAGGKIFYGSESKAVKVSVK